MHVRALENDASEPFGRDLCYGETVVMNNGAVMHTFRTRLGAAWAMLVSVSACGGANTYPGGASSASRPPETTQSQQAATVPSGEAVGQKFEAWLAAVNSGDPAKIAAVWSGAKQAEHRTAADVELAKRSGGLTLHHIEDATESEMVAVVRGRRSERWSCLVFKVDADPPHDVETILLRPTSAPTDKDKGDNGAPFDDKARKQVIQAFIRELHRAYVFPDKAEAMDREINQRQKQHSYDAIASRLALAHALTSDAQRVSRDKHLRIELGCPGQMARPDNDPASTAGRPAGPPSPDAPHVFGKSQRLDGNVAYLDIATFGVPAGAARDEIKETMNAVADAAAIVFDLRKNNGGDPETVALVTSYVFGKEPVHLNSLQWRVSGRTDDFFTDPNVQGGKFGPDKPVFVLTSGRTFSAAEEFAYNLQVLKRATIVGEATGGGANPGQFMALPHGFLAFVPSARAINPVTKTNWEGTGVKPDVETSAQDALERAHQLALERAKAR